MNIVEAYIKLKGHLIIIISGLLGSGRKKVAQELGSFLKIKVISQKEFFKEGTEHYSDDAVDWTKLNDFIKNEKAVVIYGLIFPVDKITPDYHVHIKVSKEKLIDARIKYLKKINKEINEEDEKIKFNKIIYPYYLDIIKRMKYDQFIDNSKLNLTIDQLVDNIWDGLQIIIERFLYK